MSEKDKERERGAHEADKGFEDLEEAMKEMILNYLLIHCYEHTAQAFVLSGRVGDSLKMSDEHAKKKAKLEGSHQRSGHPLKKGQQKEKGKERDWEREAEMEVDQDPTLDELLERNEKERPAPRNFGDTEEQMEISEEALERSGLKEKERDRELEQLEDPKVRGFAVHSLLNRPEFLTISHRRYLRQLIMDRKIEEAIRECNLRFPGMLSLEGAFKEVLFLLKSQHFVEMIHAKVPADVLFRFAQTDLAPFGFLGPSYLDQLRDLLALSATENPKSSPVGGYLDSSRLEHVWESLNLSILEFCKSSASNTMEKIVRQTTLVSEVLSNEPGIQHKKWHLENIFNDKMPS